jgi:hypothetical protein
MSNFYRDFFPRQRGWLKHLLRVMYTEDVVTVGALSTRAERGSKRSAHWSRCIAISRHTWWAASISLRRASSAIASRLTLIGRANIGVRWLKPAACVGRVRSSSPPSEVREHKQLPDCLGGGLAGSRTSRQIT